MNNVKRKEKESKGLKGRERKRKTKIHFKLSNFDPMKNKLQINKEEKISLISASFAQILTVLNPDYKKDPNLKDTPLRVAKMWVNETCGSYFTPPPKITVFKNTRKADQIVLEKSITFTSMCAHHFLPFKGVCHIAYHPKDFVIGLSKMHRIVKHFSKLPQLQENLTEEICQYLCEVVETPDVMVIMKASHNCVSCRGVEDHTSETITSAVRGMFYLDSAKNEVLQLLKL